ncbi:MAG: T9SS type A sorting domain-containing protein [Flavobacteriales bacterium]|nr:T9SS type A sorting domain-containing protein [Flavobacteriales bacterium]
MKKTITFISAILISAGLFAQVNNSQNYNKKLLKAKNDKIIMTGEEALSHLMVNPNPTTSSNTKSASSNEVFIGTTTYDLQSNAAVQNRIVHHANGTISAGWTTSQELNVSFSDRGTGYNYFDGTSWGTIPTNRLENSRGGWPSIIAMGSGKEASVTHNTDNSYINMTHRSAVGTGNWTEQIISPIDSNGIYRDLTWNRTAVGGLNKETLHMVGIANASDTVNIIYGIPNALLYYRSQDEGVTWDIKDMQLPTLDSANFNRFSGDSYSLTAQGETVVLAYFNDWGDSFIIKSTDNGTTWTKTIFLDFPVDKYTIDSGLDLDNDDTLDNVYSTDNYGTVILDPSGEAHVFYGIMMYLDDDLTDASSSWFPGVNGIAYWNESMGPDLTPATVQDTSLWYSDMMNNNIIAEAPDLDGDGQVAGVDSSGGYALYYSSRASMPNAGLSANGDIYLSFSAYTENADNGTQVYRHLYVTKSSDGGSTWEIPVDITPNVVWSGMKECVFGSMAPTVDDKLRIVYQMDNEPGLIVRGDEDFVESNDIVYLEIDTAGLFDGTTSISENNKIITNLSVFPNPANELTTLAISLERTKQVKITIVDLLGKEITTQEKVMSSGMTTETIDVSDYQNGIYFINLQVGTQVTTKKLVITK